MALKRGWNAIQHEHATSKAIAVRVSRQANRKSALSSAMAEPSTDTNITTTDRHLA